MLDVDLADLDIAERVADGGHGVVYRLLRPEGLLLKLYHEGIDVLADELLRLIRLPAGLSNPHRRVIGGMTAWPRRRVFRRGRCVGLLMPQAPARFATVLAGRSRLLELQFLLYPRRAMWADLPLPSEPERCRLAVRYLRLFQILHRNEVVVGDVSMRNLLWTLAGRPEVFAIDCDGFRLVGRPPAVRTADTAGWTDPSGRPGEATLDTDRYKLAMLSVRLLLGDHAVTPGDVCSRADVRATLGPVLSALAVRATHPGRRPAADFWISAITGRCPTGDVDLIRDQYAGEAHARTGSRGWRDGSRPRR